MHRAHCVPRGLLTLLLTLPLILGGSFLAVAQTGTPTQAPITILLMGSDARPGERIDKVRSDILVLLHLDPATQACRMLSIPRDTRVDVPGVGQTKINHALMEGGVPLARETVENFLGIDVDYYALTDFVGAARMIDGLGGVTIVNDTAFTIRKQDFPTGEQRLDGERAVLYARYRGGPDGDFGRIQRQQQVFAALIRKVGSASVPQLLQATVGAIGPHMKTDLNAATLLEIVTTWSGACTSGTLIVDTIPDSVQGMYFDDLLQQELWFVIVDPAIVREKADALIYGH